MLSWLDNLTLFGLFAVSAMGDGHEAKLSRRKCIRLSDFELLGLADDEGNL
jgi:hypothetical protein